MHLGKLIGIGNTAKVYELEDNKVLKLFNKNFPEIAINMEYSNALAINEMNFLKPKAYDMITYDDSLGIIYDRLDGETLLDWALKTGDIDKCASIMSKLHKEIMNNEVQGVPNYKDFLRHHIPNNMTLSNRNELLNMIDKLADGHSLCHGDFHPGNILMSNGLMYIIDFMNICYGHYLYDIARTVFLVEYTPAPIDAEDKDTIIQLKRALADKYLKNMNVTRDMIKDYLTVIIEVRKGECPDE